MSERMSVIHDEHRERILIAVHGKLVATLTYDEAQEVQKHVDDMLPENRAKFLAFMQELTVEPAMCASGYPHTAELTMKLVNLSLEDINRLKALRDNYTQAFDVVLRLNKEYK